jgi:hypothetical protein
MDRNSAFDLTCSCGRTFSQLGAFKNHRNTCKASKKRLSSALAKAKAAQLAKKRHGSDVMETPTPADSVNDPAQLAEALDPEHNQTREVRTNDTSCVRHCNARSVGHDNQLDDESRPAKRRRQIPSRFRGLKLHDSKLKDILPQPAPALPPPGVASQSSMPPLPSSTEDESHDNIPNPSGNSSRGVRGHFRRVLTTARNSFGLFRRFHAENFPSHDPEGEVDISALSNIVDMVPQSTLSPLVNPSFAPFPGQSSFLLGDWYWNHGVQKSQENFKELLRIVGAEDFHPAEVRTANWQRINRQLALNDWDKEEWVDEDAGWRSSPVTITVPFHRLTDNPGTRDYMANFYRRSLISVIQDKIKNQSDHPHFHYEPYELKWQPTDDREEVCVHGEMYTSKAFVDAHNDLHSSPGEPGCNLPRVVVALMFWSDATHLTNFGNAKLWPLYMFFGNESKYRRCKPSCNLCEHVAYFEMVRICKFWLNNFVVLMPR